MRINIHFFTHNSIREIMHQKKRSDFFSALKKIAKKTVKFKKILTYLMA